MRHTNPKEKPINKILSVPQNHNNVYTNKSRNQHMLGSVLGCPFNL